jgi:glycogen operon protein
MDAADPVPHPPFAVEPGGPAPLGATAEPGGTRFAVHSAHAQRLVLVLYSPGGQLRGEVLLEPDRHRTGDVWHAFVRGVRPGAEYHWRAEGHPHDSRHAFDPRALLLDPYARGIAGSERWADRTPGRLARRAVVLDLAYDWGDDRPPGTPLERTILYETHVRAFTAHPSSGVRHPGTFAGLAEKAGWFRALGVTSVQLMPVAEFDETDNPRLNPFTGERLLNAWGYSPLAFMSPRTAYAADATAAGALREFRDMVRALHAHGLEVVLDVVFNHTGEGSRAVRPRAWRGLDRASYFLLDAAGRDVDFTGCGHTFACARAAPAQLILDALRFWAAEMHVDGFRFDLASTLTRGEHGEPLDDPPLLRRIAADPVLARCKLIAEPWDMGLYQVGRFPHHGRIAELNGRYRDDVRDWLRHRGGGADALVTRLEGSRDLYRDGRSPGHSVNFLTSHDGFTLADLVSHERKHNEANGERNRDGTDDHRSWNGGAEGPSHDPAVRAARARQVRNAAALLLLSRGAVLWLWGDDMLRSQGGNNNPWCQDGPAWWLDWEPAPLAREFQRFVAGLLSLRRSHPALAPEARMERLDPGPDLPGARPGHHRLALRFAPEGESRDEALMLLANAGPHESRFALPAAPASRAWHVLVDTASGPPGDWTPPERSRPVPPATARTLAAHSLVLLAARGAEAPGP